MKIKFLIFFCFQDSVNNANIITSKQQELGGQVPLWWHETNFVRVIEGASNLN